MAQTVLNVRVDSDVKKKADFLFKKMGMNTATAINVFLRQAIHDQKIPFYISAKENDNDIENDAATDHKHDEDGGFWDPRNQAYLEDQVRLFNEGKLKFTPHELIEV